MQFLACPVQFVFLVEGCFSSLRWVAYVASLSRVVVGWYAWYSGNNMNSSGVSKATQRHGWGEFMWIWSCQKATSVSNNHANLSFCGVQDLIWYVVHRLQHPPAINWACFLWFLGGGQWNQQAGSRSKRKAGFGSDATESVSQMIATLPHIPGCVVHQSFNMNDIWFFRILNLTQDPESQTVHRIIIALVLIRSGVITRKKMSSLSP